jgi:ATP-dependent DNA helicase RecG
LGLSIQDSIQKGEGKTIEFKVEMPNADKIAKTVIAFANGAGGKLIIGISDQGEIAGIPEIDLTDKMDRISNILHDMVHPMVLPDIYGYALEDKMLLVIEVYPSPIKPHFMKSLGKLDGTYIRVGATNKKADLEYIQELERQKLNISFDEDYWQNSDEELSEISVVEHIEPYFGRSLNVKDLENMKLIREINGKRKYTNSVPIVLGL